MNINAKTIQGVAAYSRIDEIEEPVDAAIILVPVAHTLQAFEECCKKGIKMIVIESAGFAETGESGESIEKGLKRLAEKYDCRFVGPNCSGIINTHHNMVQSIGAVGELRKGNIGLIVQAGVYAAGMLWGMRHIMDFAVVATIGNKADINETDDFGVSWGRQQCRSDLHVLEDVKSGRRFVDVARN